MGAPRVAISGLGAVGARICRQLLTSPEAPELMLHDADRRTARAVVRAMGGDATLVVDPDGLHDADVLVLATPAGAHVVAAGRALAAGQHVVSLSDDVADVRGLLHLGEQAEQAGRSLAVGAGYSPGLTGVLARHGAAHFDIVDEIHVARTGTGGPACARQHHRALADDGCDWWEGGWRDRAGRSGRELVFFPEPVGGRDCYRAALADPFLLAPNFPGVQRVTARMAATRRDRLTARLPMLRKPHDDGGLGGIHVELRGRRGGVTDSVVFGAADQFSVGAATTAAVAATWALEGRLPPGAAGLAAIDDTTMFLTELGRRGVRVATFEGWVS